MVECECPDGKEKKRKWVDEDMAVNLFACDMKNKLAKNRHKEHWGNYDYRYMLDRIEEELTELYQAVLDGNPEDIIQECADVANFAMMIADNAGALE